ncbi:dethiobiotin synthase [Paenalcaligenes sp. Me131]|uniref:dethiobiotin synthase n=1 Tax=Paenalcaligenes sp. Me131 TaxID=3392636 RepID=UPI003D2998B1
MAKTYFVGGIDTNIGKTVTTGFIAGQWRREGHNVITQKLVQTGNPHISEDIVQHRSLMGMGLIEDDYQGWTMPQVFSYPASPHLAARLDGKTVDLDAIANATQYLEQRYDRVLVEGAGGLLVPLTDDVLTLDYVQQKQWPIILVTTGRLGSISHTLLSLQAIAQRQLKVEALAYNHIHDHEDERIAQDTLQYLRNYVQHHHPEAQFLEVPVVEL